MEYTCTTNDSLSTIKIIGNLTFDDHGAWREMFELVLLSHPKKIVLDLQELVTFDSAALGLILIFQAKAVNGNAEFEILQPETGYLKYALNCTDITCVPGAKCVTEDCTGGPDGAENPASRMDNDTQPRMDNWANVFGPLNVR